MATLPKLVYNFNENSATTIRDYSESGYDGTSSTITVQASARVGYEGYFNSTTDSINMGNVTTLNSATAFSIHLGFKGTGATASSDLVLSKVGQLTITWNASTGAFSCSITDVSANVSTVTATLVVDTYYDIDITFASLTQTLYIDGVSTDTDATLTDALPSNTNTMYLGYNTSDNGGLFYLNELKIYDAAISTDNIAAFIAEQNGVNTDNDFNSSFAVGDIIAANITLDPASSLYAIVSFVGTGSDYRILPLSDNIRNGLIFRRVGHLWDTTRQWSVLIDVTPRICFYDGVSLSSEAFTDAKKTYCINQYGVILPSLTKTANYTVTNSDARIYVDSSGGAFTITLPSSPVTGKEIEIIDSVGSCTTYNVTVNGNGKNIIGNTTALMNMNYIAFILVYNGTQWNLK
jgi:hypothetical protein